MKEPKQTSRRDFIRMATTTALAAIAAPAIWIPRKTHAMEIPARSAKRVAPSDRIGLATIGMGIIGFVDTQTALQVPGVEFVAASDCYDARLVRAKEVLGHHVFTTRAYEEILARSDVDAVIVSTPDHWHARIGIDAMEAGKDVYGEKPMVQKVKDGPEMIKVQKRTRRIFQVGSQRASSIVYDKARELYRSGFIGVLNMVEANYNRNSALGAWQYSIPPNASEKNIDWKRFLGPARKRSFDPTRFFRWRNYWDYGTGIPGDLYVHLFTGIHHVLDSQGPNRIMSTGGLRFWKDGRDVPDIMLGLYDYPETKGHPPFTLALQTNFADGGGGGSSHRLIGNEGVMTIDGRGITVSRIKSLPPSEDELVEGYNSVRTFSEAVQKEFVEEYRARHLLPDRPQLSETQEYRAPSGYDSRYDHFTNFFTSVRTRKQIIEDTTFGLQAAAPALLTNTSYLENRMVKWDPMAFKVK